MYTVVLPSTEVLEVSAAELLDIVKRHAEKFDMVLEYNHEIDVYFVVYKHEKERV